MSKLAALRKVYGIQVDIDAIAAVSHQCDPHCCKTAPCCSRYQVTISRSELRNIVGYFPQAAKSARRLHANGSFANVFEDVWRNRLVIDQNHDGLCAFAYRSRGKNVLCSLHTAAISFDEDPVKAKPFVCNLWPLAISGGKKKLLSVARDVLMYPCNQERVERDQPLSPSVMRIIQTVFGTRFLDRLVRTAETTNFLRRRRSG
jgi:hypothetical protein